jgi:hypothetical protein
VLPTTLTWLLFENLTHSIHLRGSLNIREITNTLVITDKGILRRPTYQYFSLCFESIKLMVRIFPSSRTTPFFRIGPHYTLFTRLSALPFPFPFPVISETHVEADFGAGYLADSTRIRPPPHPFYKTPPPLSKVHDNPFITPAPVVTPSVQNRQRPRNPNLFPPSREKNDNQFDSSADDTEWMNHFEDPGPAINNPFRHRTRDAPQSHQFRMASSNDGAHSQDPNDYSERDSARTEWNENRKNNFVELQTFGGKPLLEVPSQEKKSRNPFPKPTGAFYQGLRAVSVSYLSPHPWGRISLRPCYCQKANFFGPRCQKAKVQMARISVIVKPECHHALSARKITQRTPFAHLFCRLSVGLLRLLIRSCEILTNL